MFANQSPLGDSSTRMPKTDIHGPGVDAAREARHKLADLEVVPGPTIMPVRCQSAGLAESDCGPATSEA